MSDDFYKFSYGPEDETGAWLIAYAGVIIARVPRIIEEKWPGITASLAKGAVYPPKDKSP